METVINRTNVIILEDDPEDMDLIERELDSYPFPFEYYFASNLEEYLNNLKYIRPDIILSDYRLPGFSGLEALFIAKEIVPEVPFIFVTGAIGEDLAAETILIGASGFVLKNNLSTLEELISDIIKTHKSGIKRPTKQSLEMPERIKRQIKANQELLSKVHRFMQQSEDETG